MVERHLGQRLAASASRYPVVVVTGPRQSGKTTLCRGVFPAHTYVNLERPDVRAFAREDPNEFLLRHDGPVVLDEIQRAPELFSYLMPLVDERRQPGRFILTGSQNFLLVEAVSQTLAGRCAIHHLLPFSLSELALSPPLTVEPFAFPGAPATGTDRELLSHLHSGSFPAIHDQGHDPQDWLAQYTQTYLERDVRSLTNVGDLEVFERFLRLCAGRTAQLLNYSGLAADCGISVMTAKRWLSVLKASFTVVLLRPHFRNFSKRLIKSPKLYFVDTGLLCYLLGVRTSHDLGVHSSRGAVFESFVVSEFSKAYLNRGLQPPLYFWRDTAGHEVDLVIDEGETLVPIEIKSGRTVAADMFDGLKWWSVLTGMSRGGLIYGGDERFVRQGVEVCPWFSL